jgi:IS30 family transposase
MNYKHLSIIEREKLQELLWQRKTIRDIAKTKEEATRFFEIIGVPFKKA